MVKWAIKQGKNYYPPNTKNSNLHIVKKKIYFHLYDALYAMSFILCHVYNTIYLIYIMGDNILISLLICDPFPNPNHESLLLPNCSSAICKKIVCGDPWEYNRWNQNKNHCLVTQQSKRKEKQILNKLLISFEEPKYFCEKNIYLFFI